jgi:DNA-binding protein H-NS
MRKPRDLDAELRALAERTQRLKSRRVTQLGELVIAAGAGELDLDVLAGALLSAATREDGAATAIWKAKGEAFFRSRPTRPAPPPAQGDRSPAGQDPDADAAGPGGPGAAGS